MAAVTLHMQQSGGAARTGNNRRSLCDRREDVLRLGGPLLGADVRSAHAVIMHCDRDVIRQSVRESKQPNQRTDFSCERRGRTGANKEWQGIRGLHEPGSKSNAKERADQKS